MQYWPGFGALKVRAQFFPVPGLDKKSASHLKSLLLFLSQRCPSVEGSFREKKAKFETKFSKSPKAARNSDEEFACFLFETGKYRCRKVRVYPRSAANNLGEIPQRMGAPNASVCKGFPGEGTLCHSSLLVSFTLFVHPHIPSSNKSWQGGKSSTPLCRRGSTNLL